MVSKASPECQVLKEYLPRICDAISDDSVIIPLASDLWASGIISGPKMSSVSQPGVSPYDQANRIMTAALVRVEQDPSLFHVVTEKIGDQGLRPLERQMNKSLVAQGVRSRRTRPRSRSPPSRSRSMSAIPSSSETNSMFKQPSCRSLKTLGSKQEIKILVVGHNGSGKSSLINEMLGKNIARVGGPDDQTDHDSVEKHRCKVGEIDVTIYDTRGLSDHLITDQSTMDSIVEIESIDIVLICHKLYGRVDDATVKELKVLVDNMDDDLVDLSVLVFTFGDEYQIRCDPVYESDEEIKENMKVQQHEIQRKFQDTMKKYGINDKIADKVPSCITCGKRNRYGEKKELPTSDNWVDDLWELCVQRCKPEARPFVCSTKRIILEMLGIAGDRSRGHLVGKRY